MGAAVEDAQRTARRTVRRLWDSDVLHTTARAGLLARSVFYVLLVYLTCLVAAQGGRGGRQANAHGALATVGSTAVGKALLAAAAVGFAGFAIARFLSAYADRSTGLPRRLTSVGQGLFYVALAAGTASYTLGNSGTGSEQQHEESTARFMALPGGRLVVAGAGLVVIGVCLWQIKTAVGHDYDDGWDVRAMPGRLRRAMPVVAVLGIGARAVVFLPVGGLLVAAAATYDPHDAKGLDGVLLTLARHPWGVALLALVALGFTVFAGYSFVEARYRDMTSGA